MEEGQMERTTVNEADVAAAAQIDWSRVCEKLALGLAKKIPTVGEAVGQIVVAFWPHSEPSIWESIVAEVERLVEKKILEFEYQRDEQEINGLKKTIERFHNADPPEKGNQLDIAIGKADDLFTKLTGSNNKTQLIPLTVVVSHLHLTLLAERQAHGAEIFAAPYDPDWQTELSDQRTAYETFFRSVYREWWAWRSSKISADWGRTQTGPITWEAWGHAKDSFSGAELTYSEGLNSVSNFFERTMLAGKRMFENNARAEMAAALASTFLLHLYDPTTAGDKPHVDPALAFIELGPFGPPTLGLEGKGNLEIAEQDVPGKLSSITVNSWNSIDGFQLHYTDHDGMFCGGSGGAPGQASVPDEAHCTGIRARFSNGIMFEAEIGFSDGTTAGPYGNKGHWTGPEIKATAGPAYALCRGGYASGSGPSGTTGTQLAVFTFAYQSMLEDPQRRFLLNAGEHLSTWDYLTSPNGYYCVLQGDANLCIYEGFESPNEKWPGVWCAEVGRPIGSYCLLLRNDGDLCVYEGDTPPTGSSPIWQSGVAPGPGSYFAFLDANHLKVFSGTPAKPGRCIWSTP
jgi:hypothetical protein